MVSPYGVMYSTAARPPIDVRLFSLWYRMPSVLVDQNLLLPPSPASSVALALKLSIDVTEATSWNQILAMSTIALLPSLVLFFAAQKYFVEGIATSGLKG